MSKQKPIKFSGVASASKIDAAAGVIYGVSVITEGPCLGHSAYDEKRMQSVPMYADAETLSGVVECAKEYKGGLKVKMNHYSGADAIVGSLKNFRVDAGNARADLHLLKNAAQRGYVLELSEEMPDAFGLSISFSGDSEIKGDRANARCTEIYSCDIVDEPAANPNGLFDVNGSNENPSLTISMDDNTKKDIGELLAAALKPVTDRIASVEASLLEAKTEQSNLSAKLAGDRDETVKATLKLLNFGAPAGAAAAPSATAQPPAETFEKHFTALRAAGKSHNDALIQAINEKPELYATYRAEAAAGKVIVLK